MAGPWWAWAAMAASAVAKQQAAAGVEKKQQQLAEAMRQYGLVKAGEQQAATQKYIDTITPEARAAQLQGAQGDVHQSLDQTVANAVKAQPMDDFGGRMSGDYQTQRQRGIEDTSARIKRAIEQLSVAGATGKMATADQIRARLAGGDVQAANQAFQNVGNAYQQAIQTVRPNRGLTTFGDLAGAIGSAGFGGIGGAGGTAASGVTNVGTLAGSTGLKLPGNSLIGLRL